MRAANTTDDKAGLRQSRLIVCADDYALSPAVSRGIRDLLSARRISATSVMAASEFWPAEAKALRACAGNASIGLHITLTDQTPLGPMPAYAPAGRFPPLGKAFKAGLLRRLPLVEIRAEVDRQLESFAAHYGAAPAHIDGHHHIHQLPGIRDIVVQTAQRIGSPIWVRVSRDKARALARRRVAAGKALIIGAMGKPVQRLARSAGLATNSGFGGVYDVIGEKRPFADLVAQMLTGLGENGLFMCHPGLVDGELRSRDAMTDNREAEYRFLLSDRWPKLLADNRLEIGPYRYR